MSATDAGLQGLPLHPNVAPLVVFGWASSEPVPVQVFAAHSTGPDGSFFVVTRVRSDRRVEGGSQIPTRVGTVWAVDAFYGAIDYVWALSDGSLGVVRGFEADQIATIAFIEQLRERDAGDVSGGFDLSDSAGLELVAEKYNTAIATGGVGSTCTTSSGATYHLWSPRGDDVYQYVSVLDRPEPLEVARFAGDTWIVAGPPATNAPRVEDVVNLAETSWADLVAAEPDEESRTVPRGITTNLTLASAAGLWSMPLVVTSIGDETRIEIDTSGINISGEAAFWVTRINGGRGGISSINGGTLGFVLRDAESIEIQVVAVDVDGQPAAATRRYSLTVEDP